MNKKKEELENIIREEVHYEFEIPIICPPNNRISEKLSKKILSAGFVKKEVATADDNHTKRIRND